VLEDEAEGRGGKVSTEDRKSAKEELAAFRGQGRMVYAVEKKLTVPVECQWSAPKEVTLR
jgi:hypothetical protein